MKYIDNRLNANIVKLKDTNNNYTSDNVEGALEEIDSKIKNIEDNGYDDTQIKQDIVNIKTEIGTEELTTTDQTIKGAVNEIDSKIKDIKKREICKPLTWDEFITNLTEGVKSFEFINTIQYNATSTANITRDDVFIDCKNATIKVNCGNVFSLENDNITVKNCKIIGEKSTLYGINVNGNNCTISDIEGKNIKYTLIMNNGESNNISNVNAFNCGWDCVSNYINSKNSIIRDCRAIHTGRHGFSTDPGAENIKFINCYCEDVGFILDEGHTSLHFEGAINCQFIDCTVRYTQNHISNNTNLNGILLCARNELSSGCKIKNLNIIIEKNFNPLNQFYFIYNTSADLIIEGLSILNESNTLGLGYLGKGNLYISGINIKGKFKFEQANALGFIKYLVNGIVELPSKDEPFYDAQYCSDGLYVDNMRFSGGSRIFKGRYINSIIKNSRFKNCESPTNYWQSTSNSGEKSFNNIFDSNIVEDVDYGICSGWYSGTNNNVISNCTFKRIIPTIFKSSGGNVIWVGNKKQDLTYTTLADGGTLANTNTDELS